MSQSPVRTSHRWYTVFALSSASLVNSMESFALEILWPSMVRTLGLTVSQLAPILSVTRTLNAITTPLWGIAADRFSRKALLVVMTGLWGLLTAATGLVRSFSQLMAIRIVSSLGLAVLYPTALSLLSDLFDRDERGRAIGFMNAAGFAGSMVSVTVLGTLAVSNPEAWRVGFVVMGVASAATGLLLIWANDPPRGAAEAELRDVLTHETAGRFEFRLAPQVIRLRSWWVAVVSENFTWIGFSILSAWGFTWIDGLGYGGQGTLALGLIFVGVVGGHVLFGWAGDALERRHPQLGRVWLGQLSMVANLLGVLGFVALGDRSLLLLGASGLLIGLATSSRGSGAFSPLLQGILLPELRATGQGLVDMTLGLLSAAALGLSGWVLARVGEDVQRMMLLMVPTTTLLGGVLWSGFFRTYPRDLAAIHNTLLQQRQEILERRTG